MRQRSGITLIELLIAAAIMIIVLTALTNLFVSTTRAYQANERASELQQNMEAAAQLLKYDIALAGYRGTENLCVSLGGAPISVTTGTGTNPDSITVRYCEDRYSSLTLQEVTFSISTASGVLNLFRQQGDSNQPIVEGVANLKVVSYRNGSGTLQTTMPALNNLAGLTIRLTFVNGATRDVSIVLHNPLG
jgi:Tfp pilus assembly protein PilW